MIGRFALTMVVTAACIMPATVRGQAASPAEMELQMQRRQRRAIVRPAPPPDVVERDVQAAAEAELRRRQDVTAQELRGSFPRRPDLDYDVKSGIQSQRLNDALRRR